MRPINSAENLFFQFQIIITSIISLALWQDKNILLELFCICHIFLKLCTNTNTQKKPTASSSAIPKWGWEERELQFMYTQLQAAATNTNTRKYGGERTTDNTKKKNGWKIYTHALISRVHSSMRIVPRVHFSRAITGAHTHTQSFKSVKSAAM